MTGPMSATTRSTVTGKRLVGVAAVLALLLVVVLDTKYVSPGEFRRLNPPAFNAETWARKSFPTVAARVKRDATDVRVLAPAIDRDLAAAGARYGHDLGSGQYSFAMKASGTAVKVDQDFVLLDVPGVPGGTEVRIPLGTALNGTPVRDCTGTITYGDFADQTDYQSAANQFKTRMQQDVLAKLDTKGLKGKRITVEGGWNTGGPAHSYIIQPTGIEVGS
jgi:predicted lipoprotein